MNMDRIKNFFATVDTKKALTAVAVVVFILICGLIFCLAGSKSRLSNLQKAYYAELDSTAELKKRLIEAEQKTEAVKEGGSGAVDAVERITKEKVELEARVGELESQLERAQGTFGVQPGDSISQEQLNANVLRWVTSARSHLNDSSLDVLSPQQKNQLLDHAADDLRKARASLNQESATDLVETIDQLASEIGRARPLPKGERK